MAVWRMIGEGGNLANPIMFTWFAVSISYAAAFGFIGVSALGVVLIIGFKVKETVGSRKVEKVTPTTEPSPELAASATASGPAEGVGS
jgi:hypothetical protein